MKQVPELKRHLLERLLQEIPANETFYVLSDPSFRYIFYRTTKPDWGESDYKRFDLKDVPRHSNEMVKRLVWLVLSWIR